MKSFVYFYLGILATFFIMCKTKSVKESRIEGSGVKDVTTEGFRIPEEILQQYLNITKNELYENCEERNMHCRTAIGLETLEVIEQKNGEKLVELIVNRARRDPPLNQELWQQILDQHCYRDNILQAIFDIGWDYIFPCVAGIVTNQKAIENVGRNYLPMYCGRVERIAKQRIARKEF